MVDTKTQECFEEWKEREAIAEAMTPLIGDAENARN